MRLPVAAKMALHSAGMTGGSAGSPRPVGRMVGGQEMHLDRRRLVDAQRLHRVEIRLHHAAAIDGDRLAQRRAQPIQRRALHLVLGAAGLMIWLPTSPTTQTWSSLMSPDGATVACTTSAK